MDDLTDGAAVDAVLTSGPFENASETVPTAPEQDFPFSPTFSTHATIPHPSREATLFSQALRPPENAIDDRYFHRKRHHRVLSCVRTLQPPSATERVETLA